MLSIEAERRIERFEAAWDERAPERINQFLAGLDDRERPEVLSELVMIDLEQRYRLGASQKQIGDYLKAYRSQYPQLSENTPLGRKIDQHLLELRHLAQPTTTAATKKGATDRTHAGRSPTVAVVGRLPCEFGDFTLRRVIGRGGMGVVFEADQQSPNRTVALKILNGDISLDTEAASRFERETELIASINNSGVVPVLESGYVEGRCYYTMPLYRQGTLRDRIQSGSLTIREGVQVLLSVTRSVAAVHALQVVHRDLKPGNILFGEGVTPLIADFGLSRHVDDSRSLTRTGEIYGTPGYIAPERIQGNNKQIDDFVADIYSLGAILYDMLCGRPPFRGGSAWETLNQAMSDAPVPPERLNPKVDVDLNAVCLKCLERLPSERYQTCSELASDLENYLAGRPVTAKPPNLIVRANRFARRHPAKAGLIASALGFLVLSWLAGFLWLELSSERKELELQSLLRRNEAFVANLANAALSMTDRSMGWRGTTLSALQEAAELRIPGGDITRLRSMVATSTVLHDLEPLATLAEGMWCDAVAFDRSGTYLALGQNKDVDGFNVLIYQTDNLSAAPYYLWIDCKTENDRRRSVNRSKAEDGARAICFSPDGTRLAVGTRHGKVHVYRWNGQQADWLGSYDPDPGVEVWRLYYSCDGQTLWTLSYRDVLRVIRKGKVEEFSALKGVKVGDVIPSPTESAVFVRLKTDDVLRFDEGRQEPRWQLSSLNRPRDLSLSHDGRFLAISFDENQQVVVVESEHGRKRKTISANVTDAEDAFWSHCFGHGDDWLISASDDRTVALWDVAQGRAITSYIVPERGGRPKITAAGAHPLIAVAEHLKVTVYEIAGAEALETACHRPAIIRNLASDSAGSRLATVASAISNDSNQQFMDYAVAQIGQDSFQMSHQAYAPSTLPSPEQAAIAFTPDDDALLIADHQGRPKIIPLRNAVSAKPLQLAMDEPTWIPASDQERLRTILTSPMDATGNATEKADPEQHESIQSLRFQLSQLPNSEFIDDVPDDVQRDVYLVGRLSSPSPSQRIRVDSRANRLVSHTTSVDTAIDEKESVAIYAGHHNLRVPRQDLELELSFGRSIESFTLEGVLLERTRVRRHLGEALQVDQSPSVSEWLVHFPTGKIWSVVDEEGLVIADYPSCEVQHRWQNESLSKQSGRGTITPLLATEDWVIAGTTFGEVFVFDARDGSVVHSAVPLSNRVRGICEISGQPLIAVGSSDGAIHVLSLPHLDAVQVISVSQQSIDALWFDERRQWLYAGSEDGTISIFLWINDRFEPYCNINLKIGHVRKLVYLREQDCLAVLINNETAVRLIRPKIIYDKLQSLNLL